MDSTFILAAADAATGNGSSGVILIVAYIIIFGGFFYFVAVRPQKKEQNKLNAMISSMECGDVVLTTSGFYGTIIDIEDDTIIVEFGNNKNCRIPMQKTAVAQLEKASKD